MMTMSDETGFSIISMIVQQLCSNDAEASDEQAARFTWKVLALQTVSRTCQSPYPYIADEQTKTARFENYGRAVRTLGNCNFNFFFRGLEKRPLLE